MRYLDEIEQHYHFMRRPLPWQKQGLRQTASGYGSKLATEYMVMLVAGEVRRVYCTQHANAGTFWITVNGIRYALRDAEVEEAFFA